ncbi:hypothetical protein FGL97_08990 [Pseudomonas putida]|uniref:primase-helicase family protein n=1 Tax=Pseudomonas putida TaxID=303 RepID=UPI00159DA543|nr:primase-helicase family protein [Pseudomonas putida]NVN63358.1 hypothetical protein [Pseudomonas putida]NVN68351.1 hypothetical protein [Pseudomonas putida]
MNVTLSQGDGAASAAINGRLCLDELIRQLSENEPTKCGKLGKGGNLDSESRALLLQISRDFVTLTGVGAPMAYRIETGRSLGKDSFVQFCDRHYGDVLFLDESGTEVDRVSAGLVWWGWKDPSRRVVDAIVMEPTNTPEADGNPEIYNRWYVLKRTMEEPNYSATMEDAAPFTNHLMQISDGDHVGVMYFLNWLAQLYQYPDTKIPVAVLMYSQFPGVGKNLVQRLLSKVFGKPLVAGVSGKRFQSNFMDAIEHRRLVFINELARSEKQDGYEDFKTQISEEDTQFEGKGRAAREIRNIAHYIVTTNNIDCLPLMRGDRRIAVLMTVNPPLAEDYYKGFVKWIDGPGAGIVANLLRTWQFPADWNPYGHAPQTIAAMTMQNAAQSTLFIKLEELRQSRTAPFDRDAITADDIAIALAGFASLWDCKVSSPAVGKALAKMSGLILWKGKVKRRDRPEAVTQVYLQTADDKWWCDRSPVERGTCLETGRNLFPVQKQPDNEVADHE